MLDRIIKHGFVFFRVGDFAVVEQDAVEVGVIVFVQGAEQAIAVASRIVDAQSLEDHRPDVLYHSAIGRKGFGIAALIRIIAVVRCQFDIIVGIHLAPAVSVIIEHHLEVEWARRVLIVRMAYIIGKDYLVILKIHSYRIVDKKKYLLVGQRAAFAVFAEGQRLIDLLLGEKTEDALSVFSRLLSAVSSEFLLHFGLSRGGILDNARKRHSVGIVLLRFVIGLSYKVNTAAKGKRRREYERSGNNYYL